MIMKWLLRSIVNYMYHVILFSFGQVYFVVPTYFYTLFLFSSMTPLPTIRHRLGLILFSCFHALWGQSTMLWICSIHRLLIKG